MELFACKHFFFHANRKQCFKTGKNKLLCLIGEVLSVLQANRLVPPKITARKMVKEMEDLVVYTSY